MKILVDADACPVKRIIREEAEKLNLQVVLFADTSHIIDEGYGEVIVVDKGRDSADIALANRINSGDVVVTQDYGVAAVALARGARVINQNGMEYNKDNIDRLLFERYVSSKIRKAGGRTSGVKKRRMDNDKHFRSVLRKMCKDKGAV